MTGRPESTSRALRWLANEMMWEEAAASVALDLHSDVHTCHAECRHPSHTTDP